MIEGLSHLTLVVSDLDRSAALLSRVLDAREVHSGVPPAREKFFVVGGVWVALLEGEVSSARTYDHVAFKVSEEDLGVYEARVRELGLEIREDRPRSAREGRSLYFYDYDNHLFELHSGTLEERLG